MTLCLVFVRVNWKKTNHQTAENMVRFMCQIWRSGRGVVCLEDQGSQDAFFSLFLVKLVGVVNLALFFSATEHHSLTHP